MASLVVVTTGGTIATSADDDGVKRPTRTGADLTSGLDVAGRRPDGGGQLACSRSPTGTGSARRSTRCPDADGVVITHGTDTMEETALWLELTYDGTTSRSYSPAHSAAPTHPDADGPRQSARRADGRRESAGAGPRCAGELRGHGMATPGPAEGRDGRPAGVRRVLRSARYRTGRSRWTHRRIGRSWPRRRPRTRPGSTRIAVYPGGDTVAMDACVAAGARGLVLEALGSGNAGAAVIDGVRRHCRDGVAVAVSTRVPGGRVSPGYGPGRDLVGRRGRDGAAAAAAAGPGSADGRVGGRLTRRGRSWPAGADKADREWSRERSWRGRCRGNPRARPVRGTDGRRAAASPRRHPQIPHRHRQLHHARRLLLRLLQDAGRPRMRHRARTAARWAATPYLAMRRRAPTRPSSTAGRPRSTVHSDTASFTRDVDVLPEGYRLENWGAICAVEEHGAVRCETYNDHGFAVSADHGELW